jgi:hypothetical protein
MKREGSGRGNWGTMTDGAITQSVCFFEALFSFLVAHFGLVD